jgi:hypothetical protein
MLLTELIFEDGLIITCCRDSSLLYFQSLAKEQRVLESKYRLVKSIN